jgi:hypothetical protein
MRRVGWVVVLLGLAALGFVMLEAGLTPVSDPADRNTSPDHAVAVGWLIAWAAVIGCAALVILIRGLAGGSNPVAEDVLTLAERIAALPPEVRAVLATLFGASQGSYFPAPKDR